MKRGILVCGLLSINAVAGAAEPPSLSAAQPSPVAAEARKPLDLRVGDIRKYMTPEEFRSLLAPPDESNTVIVKADAPPVPMRSDLNVPGGLIAPFWALAHPTQAWRLFMPDARVNIKDIPPLENKVPPPIFRWGP